MVWPEPGQVEAEVAAGEAVWALGREPAELAEVLILALVSVSTLEPWVVGWVAALAEESLVACARVAAQPERRQLPAPAHGALRGIG
jgi:hypothetical protein